MRTDSDIHPRHHRTAGAGVERLDRRRRFLALLAISAISAIGAGGACPERLLARSGTDSSVREFVRVVDRAFVRVGLSITVTDRRGQPVRGLGQDDFRLFEDDRDMALQDFGPEGTRADRPLSVAILLDLSKSMGSQIKRVKEAARALLEGLREGDEVMVAKFNEQLTILLPFTGDPDEPARSIKNLGRARGGTAIFRAVGETLRDLRGRKGRKVILVVSDGLDNDVARDQHVLQSLYLQDLLRLCFRTETVVYGIRPGMSSVSWLPFEGFVEETGGSLLYTGGDLERLFRRLGEQFLSQYYLAYDIDPNEREGRRRTIRVEVDRPGVMVKAMRGYTTPPSHLETLLADLRDEDVELRADAAYELGFVGDDRAARKLRLALRDEAADVRGLAIEALVRLEASEAIPDIAGRLGDPASEVRDAADSALIRFGPLAVPHLLDRVERGQRRRRARPTLVGAVSVLGRVGDDRALPPLSAMLERGPANARPAAARALGNLGLSGGILALRAALAEGSAEVRLAALRSIVAIAGGAARPVVEDYITRETNPSLRAAARALLDGS
jgi:VWFA-related protein